MVSEKTHFFYPGYKTPGYNPSQNPLRSCMYNPGAYKQGFTVLVGNIIIGASYLPDPYICGKNLRFLVLKGERKKVRVKLLICFPNDHKERDQCNKTVESSSNNANKRVFRAGGKQARGF